MSELDISTAFPKFEEKKSYEELVLFHAGKVLDKISHKTISDWEDDENLQDAVCMRLFAMAEALKKYYAEHPEVHQEYQGIPWKEIIRFRDKVGHDYANVLTRIVWEIASEQLWPLYQIFSKIVSDKSRPGE